MAPKHDPVEALFPHSFFLLQIPTRTPTCTVLTLGKQSAAASRKWPGESSGRAAREPLVRAPRAPRSSLRATWRPLPRAPQAPGGDVETPLHCAFVTRHRVQSRKPRCQAEVGPCSRGLLLLATRDSGRACSAGEQWGVAGDMSTDPKHLCNKVLNPREPSDKERMRAWGEKRPGGGTGSDGCPEGRCTEVTEAGSVDPQDPGGLEELKVPAGSAPTATLQQQTKTQLSLEEASPIWGLGVLTE